MKVGELGINQFSYCTSIINKSLLVFYLYFNILITYFFYCVLYNRIEVIFESWRFENVLH